jgi:LysM repeat protein
VYLNGLTAAQAAACTCHPRSTRSISVAKHRRKRKIVSTGRHAAPSHVQVLTRNAGKTVPAAAMMGVLTVASPAFELASPVALAAAGRAVAGLHLPALHRASLQAPPAPAVLLAKRKPAQKPSAGHPSGPHRTYTVRPGDTLSGIAFRFYGQAIRWRWLYQVNRSQISNPNRIHPGQVLRVPPYVPASFRRLHPAKGATPRAQKTAHHRSGIPHGNLGCAGLKTLWGAAGGAPAAARTAASIAMAESSGHQYTTGSFGERGYWQINPNHGALSTYDAYGNARAAVILSGDGTNWSPWTTYVDGAYVGKC